MKLPKIIRNKQHRGELVSASEEAVGRIQAVLFGSSIPETARMDINCATNDAVAAGERIPHCARTAIGTVVAMAGTHAMQCGHRTLVAGARHRAPSRAGGAAVAVVVGRTSAAANRSPPAHTAAAVVVVVAAFPTAPGTGRQTRGCGGTGDGGGRRPEVFYRPLPLAADLFVAERMLSMDSAASILAGDGVKKLLDRLGPPPEQ